MELFRQWKILIEDVEITNHTDKLMSPFIKFTIGGDYFVSFVFLICQFRLKLRSLPLVNKHSCPKASKDRYS